MSIASVVAVSLGIIVSATPPKLDSEGFARRQPAADTLVDVGGHRLHLSVWDGEGPVTILFEAGGGADASGRRCRNWLRRALVLELSLMTEQGWAKATGDPWSSHPLMRSTISTPPCGISA